MKNLRRFLIAVGAVLLTATAAHAQIRLGVKGGLNYNKVHYSSELRNDLTSWQNAAGWTAGLMLEFNVPVLNLGVDGSVMYTRMNNGESFNLKSAFDWLKGEGTQSDITGKNFIEVPINLKYKLALPAIREFVMPYVATGPTVAFKLDDDSAAEIYKTRTCQVGWNFGFGVELLEHLQVGASYAVGMNNILYNNIDKSLQQIGLQPTEAKARNDYWTVTAAYMF